MNTVSVWKGPAIVTHDHLQAPIHIHLMRMDQRLNERLNLLQVRFRRDMESLTRSIGQRTRVKA